MNRCSLIVLVMFWSFCSVLAGDGSRHTSKLWGESGERWQPTGRLTDFSYAGYHRGERPIPKLNPAEADLNARDFGARGDGKTDDTAALKKAIAAAAGKLLYLPAGRYVVTDVLEIRASGTRLLGAGSGKTVLVFPKPLNDIHPNWGETTSGLRTSNYAWSGGFIRIAGGNTGPHLADVTQPADRGDTVLAVSSTKPFESGQFVRMDMRDDTGSLMTHLYAGDPGPIDNIRHTSARFSAKVVRVDEPAGRITIDRPLRTDVRPEWSPRIYLDQSRVEEVGIVGIGFEFPVTPYGGHFSELGFNPLTMSGVRNCWVKDVRIANADSGPFVRGCQITLEGITIVSDRSPGPRGNIGHHGVTLTGQDCLLRDFDIRCRFVHDVTISGRSASNVFADGRAEDLSIDAHRHGPHNNLFTNIDAGEGTRLFRSGGGAKLGRHSAAWNTLWNIRTKKHQRWPKGWGPSMINLVGLRSDQPPVTEPQGKWFEPTPPGAKAIQPLNLCDAQLRRRLGE